MMHLKSQKKKCVMINLKYLKKEMNVINQKGSE